jgi:uncharacterized membrane protein
VFAALLGGFSLALGTLFLAMGAWLVLPFLGAEVAFAVAMVALHARASGRRSELLLLVPGRLTVARTDGRGRREEIVLDPYWARLTHREDPGNAGTLVLESRGRSVEIGRDLAAEDKASLHAALRDALAQARQGVFF